MSWKDRFGPASYQGAKFFVKTGELTGGRRTIIHEYPLRDNPFAEDIGRAPRRFEVEGYVIGDNYLADRDALFAALETAGPGELVHPLYGTKRVSLDGQVRIRESTDMGGMAVFTIPFVETPAKPSQPTNTPDPSGVVAVSASAASAATQTEFLATFKPGQLMGSVIGAITAATQATSKVLAAATTDEQTLAGAASAVRNLESNVTAIANEPANLMGALVGVYGAVTSIAGLANLYNFNPGALPPATTAQRLQEQQNFLAFQYLIQRLALIQAATLLPSQTFTSYEDAVNQRDSITALIDAQAEVATDDTFPALVQLRADLVNSVPGPSSTLAHLIAYTPITTAPSLVIAHRLYGDVNLEQDIIDRNDIPDPGFIRGGISLEVLSSE